MPTQQNKYFVLVEENKHSTYLTTFIQMPHSKTKTIGVNRMDSQGVSRVIRDKYSQLKTVILGWASFISTILFIFRVFVVCCNRHFLPCFHLDLSQPEPAQPPLAAVIFNRSTCVVSRLGTKFSNKQTKKPEYLRFVIFSYQSESFNKKTKNKNTGNKLDKEFGNCF